MKEYIDKQTEEIEAYKISDGRIFEKEDEANNEQMKINITEHFNNNKESNDFIKHTCDGKVDSIIEFMEDNFSVIGFYMDTMRNTFKRF